jgi:hypothetical protein
MQRSPSYIPPASSTSCESCDEEENIGNANIGNANQNTGRSSTGRSSTARTSNLSRTSSKTGTTRIIIYGDKGVEEDTGNVSNGSGKKENVLFERLSRENLTQQPSSPSQFYHSADSRSVSPPRASIGSGPTTAAMASGTSNTNSIPSPPREDNDEDNDSDNDSDSDGDDDDSPDSGPVDVLRHGSFSAYYTSEGKPMGGLSSDQISVYSGTRGSLVDEISDGMVDDNGGDGIVRNVRVTGISDDLSTNRRRTGSKASSRRSTVYGDEDSFLGILQKMVVLGWPSVVGFLLVRGLCRGSIFFNFK